LVALGGIPLGAAGCGGEPGARDVGGKPGLQPAGPVLKQGGDVPPQPARLDRANPPLVEAACTGNARRVRALLDGGAEVNAFGSGRTTARMAAAEGGREEVVRLLIERKADANLRNAKGQTAAEVAEAAGRTRLRALLQGTEVKPPPGPANPPPGK
jgi:hypothetical protein